jgi:hypothetical protein
MLAEAGTVKEMTHALLKYADKNSDDCDLGRVPLRT